MADDENTESPFTRPGFIVSAVVIALVLVLGAILGTAHVMSGSRDTQPEAAPATTSLESSPAAEESSSPAADTSTCGLEGEVLEGTVESAPEAEWKFQGTIGYPASSVLGPAVTDPSTDVRTCFQHSPEGAVMMAANAVSQSADPATSESWAEAALAEGPEKDVLLAADAESSSTSGVRLQIIGFHVLSYDGQTALIDLAIQGEGSGQSVTMSAVYTLTWEDGDWKILVTDAESPVNFSTISSTEGYVEWGPNHG